jgi:chromate transporter
MSRNAGNPKNGSAEDARDAAQAASPGSWSLFRVFFGISAVTVGGGYAMVPVIGQALEKRGWIGEEEFYRLFARAQSFPGPFAFTTALIVGKRLAGPAGAAAAGLGVVLPPFGAIVVVGALLRQIGDLSVVKSFLAGAGATVPGLVAAMVYKIAKRRSWNVFRAVSTLGLAAALALLPGLTLPVFLAAAALLYLSERRWTS